VRSKGWKSAPVDVPIDRNPVWFTELIPCAHVLHVPPVNDSVPGGRPPPLVSVLVIAFVAPEMM